MGLRLVEEPLGGDAEERPTLEQVTATWASALRQPVPAYDSETLFQFLRQRGYRSQGLQRRGQG